MKIKELLTALSGESVTLVLNSKVTINGTLIYNVYSAVNPYVSTDYVKITFDADCITQITCTNTDDILEIELTPETKAVQTKPTVLIPAE